MSNYKNFIQDFPVRCGEILKRYKEPERKRGREVTFMLTITATAILIPFERLKKHKDIKHPSGDKERYVKATGKFNEICGKKFLQSVLWKDEVKSWKIGEVEEAKVKEAPEEWAQSSLSLSENIKVGEIVNILRNAFAHGSIFTLPNAKDQIENTIFLSRIMNGCKFSGKYRFLTVLPEDFYEFLVKWIQFLQNELKLH